MQGQSNMEYSVNKAFNASAEIADSIHCARYSDNGLVWRQMLSSHGVVSALAACDRPRPAFCYLRQSFGKRWF